jgi:FkbM family methyltransferase
VIPENLPPQTRIELYEKLSTIIKLDLQEGGSVHFFVPNRTVLWRVATIATKEPETYVWALSLTADDVLVDVGANIGLFSLLAGAARGARVFAFEPEAQNYALLAKNIAINGACDRITAYCAAVSEKFSMDRLFTNAVEPGASGNQFARDVTLLLVPRQSTYSQGSIGVSLDEAVSSGFIPQPTHMKVDVDGFEHLVVAGARTILTSPAMRSVILETNMALAEHRAMFEQMVAMGYTFDQDQMNAAQANISRQFGETDIFNIVFSH